MSVSPLIARQIPIRDGDKVTGFVDVALERAFLPPAYEADLPTDADAAAEFVAKHPERSDLRVVDGVLRDGARHGLARVVTAPDDLLGSEDLVPGLAEALLATFREEDS